MASILVLLAHPRRGSFNHAIAEAATSDLYSAGHRVFFHDLCEEQFPSHLPSEEISADGTVPPLIEQHCKELNEADGVIVIHPNWWGQPPAVLKGWVDRVVRPESPIALKRPTTGKAFPSACCEPVPHSSSTRPIRLTNGNKPSFTDPLETIWKNCIFGLCGVKDFFRRMFSVVVTSSPRQRVKWLREVQETVIEVLSRQDASHEESTPRHDPPLPVGHDRAVHRLPRLANGAFRSTTTAPSSSFWFSKGHKRV